MTRVVARTSQALIDVAVLSIAYWLAFCVRFDWIPPFQMFKRLMFTWSYVVSFQFILLVLFGVPRFAWRYVGLRESVRVGAAVGVASSVLLVFRFVAGALVPQMPHAQYAVVPVGVIVMDYAFAFLGIVGVRVLRRLIGERTEANKHRVPRGEAVPTMLVGAGQAGVIVAKEIAGRQDLRIEPVGFVDDDPAKRGIVVHGVPVLGPTRDLAKICAARGVRDVLITIANAPGREIRRIADLCEDAGISVKIIPGIYEIVGGHVNLSRIRQVAIEDLLRREPVTLDDESIEGVVRGRTVLVTGAGGSIGSELCRQVCRYRPATLLLVERAENALFDIHRELSARHRDLDVVPLVADICDRSRMRSVFATHRPAVVFHAAAHKHVPMMEWNPGEAVKNNVFGTKTIVDVSDEHGVEIFVQVSTDKAVNPSSVMGASKRLAEMYLQSMSTRSETRFVTVRFGNVLGSAGSVVQLFREQIASGGPVTVTHPDMKRYFMMIPEACELVLQTAALADGGEVFLLDMGEPVKIVDLAEDMIRLSGYEPGRDIKIEFTGIRSGEKLFEELLGESENSARRVHPKILVGRIPPVVEEEVDAGFARLAGICDADPKEVLRIMKDLVPEATFAPAIAPRPRSSERRPEAGEGDVGTVRPVVPQPAS